MLRAQTPPLEAEYSLKKKWTAVDVEEGEEAQQPKKLANEALTRWVKQEKEQMEAEVRKQHIRSRAKLLGFEYLDKNRLKVDREPREVADEDKDTCSCSYNGMDCSDERCVNRSSLTECFPDKCEVTSCRNQRFQRREWVDFSLVKRGRMGYGVQAEQDIKKGQFVMEYVGEILDEEEKTRRLDLGGVRHHYTMLLDNTHLEYIDPSCAGNFGRFLNHSCEPNCETQKWQVLGEHRMGFFAKRDIAKGEDLTFNYQFERSGKTAQRCLCGAPSCCGWIGAKKEGGGRKDAKDGKDGDDSSIHEQKDDAEEPDDPLALGEDGAKVRPWAELSKKLAEKVRHLDATLFLVTADLIGPLLRAAKRDCARESRGAKRRLYLPRNMRRCFAMFYRVMDPEVTSAQVLQECNSHRPYAPRPDSILSIWFTAKNADKRDAIDRMIGGNAIKEEPTPTSVVAQHHEPIEGVPDAPPLVILPPQALPDEL
jgi:hypothetical protein